MSLRNGDDQIWSMINKCFFWSSIDLFVNSFLILSFVTHYQAGIKRCMILNIDFDHGHIIIILIIMIKPAAVLSQLISRDVWFSTLIYDHDNYNNCDIYDHDLLLYCPSWGRHLALIDPRVLLLGVLDLQNIMIVMMMMMMMMTCRIQSYEPSV